MASLRDRLAAKKAEAGSNPAPAPAPEQKQSSLRFFKPGQTEPRKDPVKLPERPSKEAEDRQLDQTTWDGEHIPMEFPSENASEAERLWNEARGGLESQLTIFVEPPPSDHAWIALKPPHGGRLILLHRLPLAAQPSNEPF